MDNDGTADDEVSTEADASKKGTMPAGQVITMKEWNKLSATTITYISNTACVQL